MIVMTPILPREREREREKERERERERKRREREREIEKVDEIPPPRVYDARGCRALDDF